MVNRRIQSLSCLYKLDDVSKHGAVSDSKMNWNIECFRCLPLSRTHVYEIEQYMSSRHTAYGVWYQNEFKCMAYDHRINLWDANSPMTTPHVVCPVTVLGHIFMVNEVIVPPVMVTHLCLHGTEDHLAFSKVWDTGAGHCPYNLARRVSRPLKSPPFGTLGDAAPPLPASLIPRANSSLQHLQSFLLDPLGCEVNLGC
jgi:hypothetical protein